MSSYDYSYAVKNSAGTTSNSLTISNTGGYNTNGTTASCTVNGCGCGGWHYYWYPYTQPYSYPPATKYLYQIFCPKPECKGKFWAELDEIKPCPVCKSRIKVTDKESDYEVAVTK